MQLLDARRRWEWCKKHSDDWIRILATRRETDKDLQHMPISDRRLLLLNIMVAK